MLVNQLTSIVLETTNPNVEDGMSKKERILGICSRSLPKYISNVTHQPNADNPKVIHTITEEEVLIPFAIITNIKGPFNFGKQVEYPDFKFIKEFDSLYKDRELEKSALEDQFPGDNNFIDSLIMGVYFHSLIQKNDLTEPYDIVRLTEKKFKKLDIEFKVINICCKVVKVTTGINQEVYVTKSENKDYSFEFKVAIRQNHSGGNGNVHVNKSRNSESDDSAVNELELVNVGIEEAER